MFSPAWGRGRANIFSSCTQTNVKVGIASPYFKSRSKKGRSSPIHFSALSLTCIITLGPEKKLHMQENSLFLQTLLAYSKIPRSNEVRPARRLKTTSNFSALLGDLTWASLGICSCAWWGTFAQNVLLLIVIDYIGTEPANREKPLMILPLLLQGMKSQISPSLTFH